MKGAIIVLTIGIGCGCAPSEKRAIVIGDSLTAANVWQGYAASRGLNIVKSNGWPGADYERYRTHADSPLIVNGEISLDAFLFGVDPNVAVFALGTNDIAPETAYTLPGAIDRSNSAAVELFEAFEARGISVIAVLPPIGNTLESAFLENYDNGPTKVLWRSNRTEYIRRSSELGRHTVYPLVSEENYPATDALHPSDSGYEQMGTAIANAVLEF